MVLATNEHKETILQVARFPPGTRLGKVSARAKVSSAHAGSPWRATEVFGPALGPAVAKQGAEYHYWRSPPQPRIAGAKAMKEADWAVSQLLKGGILAEGGFEGRRIIKAGPFGRERALRLVRRRSGAR